MTPYPVDVDIFLDKKTRAIKPTQTKGREVDNSYPKIYSQVEFFCDILQLNFILT